MGWPRGARSLASWRLPFSFAVRSFPPRLVGGGDPLAVQGRGGRGDCLRRVIECSRACVSAYQSEAHRPGNARGLAAKPGRGETRRSTAAHGLTVTSARPNVYGLQAHCPGAFEVQDEGSQLLGGVGWKRGPLRPSPTSALRRVARRSSSPPPSRPHGSTPSMWTASDWHGLRTRAANARAHVAIHPRAPAQRRPLRAGPRRRAMLGARRAQARTGRTVSPRPGDVHPVAGDPAGAARGRVAAPRSRRSAGLRDVYGSTWKRNAQAESRSWTGTPSWSSSSPAAPAAFLEDGFFVALPHRHDTDGFFGAVMERKAPPRTVNG